MCVCVTGVACMFKSVISALYDDKNSEKIVKGAWRVVLGATTVFLKIIFSLLSELWEKGHGSVGVETKRS